MIFDLRENERSDSRDICEFSDGQIGAVFVPVFDDVSGSFWPDFREKGDLFPGCLVEFNLVGLQSKF